MRGFDVEYVVMCEIATNLSNDPDSYSKPEYERMFIAFRGEESRPIAEACYHTIGEMLMQVPEFGSIIEIVDESRNITGSNPYGGEFEVYDEAEDTLYTVSVHRQYAVYSGLGSYEQRSK